MSDVTRILDELKQGDPQAADKLLPLVYDELRKIAAVKMAQEAAGHTLQPTALVHEAWLRLVGSDNPQFHGRSHFCAAAAETMRHILVDSARRKRSLKRGGLQEREELHESQIAVNAPAEEILAVHDALEQLAVEDAVSAELVKLRYFAGMNMDEAAMALDIPLRRAERIWSFARAWLRQKIAQ